MVKVPSLHSRNGKCITITSFLPGGKSQGTHGSCPQAQVAGNGSVQQVAGGVRSPREVVQVWCRHQAGRQVCMRWCGAGRHVCVCGQWEVPVCRQAGSCMAGGGESSSFLQLQVPRGGIQWWNQKSQAGKVAVWHTNGIWGSMVAVVGVKKSPRALRAGVL